MTSIPRGGEGRHIAFIPEEGLGDIIKELAAEGMPYVRGAGALPQVFCEDGNGNLVELNAGLPRNPIGGSG